MAPSFTIVADIAGQIGRAQRSPWITCAAVAIADENLEKMRGAIPADFPKWRDSGRREIALVCEAMTRWAAGMSATSLHVVQPAWELFWAAADTLAKAQTLQDGKPAGLTKAPNVIKARLMLSSTTIASSLAARKHLPTQGANLVPVEQKIMFDDEFHGETRELVIDFWNEIQFKEARRLGIDLSVQDFQLVDDKTEPLMMFADYLAGIRHAREVDPRGGPPMPASPSDARKRLRVLEATGRLASKREEFDWSYRDMFGEVMDAAEALARKRDAPRRV
jgi:hypothetical protein